MFDSCFDFDEIGLVMLGELLLFFLLFKVFFSLGKNRFDEVLDWGFDFVGCFCVGFELVVDLFDVVFCLEFVEDFCFVGVEGVKVFDGGEGVDCEEGEVVVGVEEVVGL